MEELVLFPSSVTDFAYWLRVAKERDMETVFGLLIFGLLLWFGKKKEEAAISKKQAAFREQDPRNERRTVSSSEDAYYAHRAKFLMRMQQYSGVPDVPSYKDAYLFKVLDAFVESFIRRTGDPTLRAKLHSMMLEYMDALSEYLADRQSWEWKDTDENSLRLDRSLARRTAVEDQLASFSDDRLNEVLLLVRSHEGGFFMNFEATGELSENGKANFPKLAV